MLNALIIDTMIPLETISTGTGRLRPNTLGNPTACLSNILVPQPPSPQAAVGTIACPPWFTGTPFATYGLCGLSSLEAETSIMGVKAGDAPCTPESNLIEVSQTSTYRPCFCRTLDGIENTAISRSCDCQPPH